MWQSWSKRHVRLWLFQAQSTSVWSALKRLLLSIKALRGERSTGESPLLSSLLHRELCGQVNLVLRNRLIRLGDSLQTSTMRAKHIVSIFVVSAGTEEQLKKYKVWHLAFKNLNKCWKYTKTANKKGGKALPKFRKVKLSFQEYSSSSCPDLFASSPHTKSISAAIILWLPQQEQQKNPATLQESTRIWHLTYGARRNLRFEILFFVACFPPWSKRSVRTWHHIQKRSCPLLDLLLDPLSHPQSLWSNAP